MYVFASEVIGVFAHAEHADKDRTGRLQPLDQRGIALSLGMVAVNPQAGDGWDAFDIEQIFHREWHAGKRSQRLSFAANPVDGVGALTRAVGEDCGECVKCRIVLLDARECSFGDGQRTLAAGDGIGDFYDGGKVYPA